MSDEGRGPLGLRPSPCGSCPYRRGVPSAVWAASEYERLRAYDGDMADQAWSGGLAPFACHSTPDLLCAGWVGHRDPADLLAVRVGVARGDIVPEALEYRTDVPLFASGAEAAEHGVRDMERPSAAARAAARKVMRLRPDVRLGES